MPCSSSPSSAYVTPVLVANGLLEPASDLTVSMPVLLTGAATVATTNGAVEFAGDMTGPGSLTITGPGTVTLAGANSYSGGTFVQQGTLALTGTLTGSVSVAAGAAFTSQGGYLVAAGETFLNAGSFTSSVPLYNLGTLTNSGTLTAPVGNTGTLTNSAVMIGDVNNVGTLINSGAIMGTLGNAGLVTGAGSVLALEQRAGGTLSPGGQGSLGIVSVFETMSTAPGSTLLMDLGPAGTSDRVAAGGAVTLNGGRWPMRRIRCLMPMPSRRRCWRGGASAGAYKSLSGEAYASTASGNADGVTYTSLGLRGTVPWQWSTLRGAARGSLAWQHAFGDVTPVSTFAFAGSQPFTVAGTPVAEDAALVEAGIDLAFSPAFTVTVFYAGQLAASAQENLFKGGLTLRF